VQPTGCRASRPEARFAPTKPIGGTARFHVDLTPRGNCHHSHFGRVVVAGAKQGQGPGVHHTVPQQPQATQSLLGNVGQRP
jgi:hypothetical protein